MAHRKYYIDFNANIISITIITADICGGVADETSENVDVVYELYALLIICHASEII